MIGDTVRTLVLALLSVWLALPATAAEILYAPEGASFRLRAENGSAAPVDICFERVEASPALALGCVRDVAPGAVAELLADVAFTAGQDAEIRARACWPMPAPGVHPQAACSGPSVDYAPVRMSPPSAPELRGP